jgi:hypothetical protein
MINKDKVKEVIKSYLPQEENETIENIAHDLVRNVEIIINSMIRQAVSQEKENLFDSRGRLV